MSLLAFCCGAAPLTIWEIITGCNVENVSTADDMGRTRSRILSYVGRKNKRFTRADLAGSPTPCGARRQVLAEFASRCGFYVNLRGNSVSSD